MPNLHNFALGLCSNEISSAPTRHARDRCKHDGASRSWAHRDMFQRAEGLNMWAEPLTQLRVPRIFNLRADPFERATT